MKIATMVRSFLPVPSPVDIIYAPVDIAAATSEGLQRQGHEVTFFAPNGSRVNTELETLNLRPLVHNQSEFRSLLYDFDRMYHNLNGLWDLYMTKVMFERARQGQYDLLHFHHPEVALPLASLYPDVPVVYTVHDPVQAWSREVLEMFQTPNQFIISISGNQRRDAPDLPYVATVHNGIDTTKYAFSDEADDYLLFAGRIVPEKGVKEAIQVAQQTCHRLIIIGPTYPDHQEYFDQHIKPHLNEKILYLGGMERDDIIKYYQKAKALLFPIQWEEPFGLTMIEAMACGTPVLAFARGSVQEVVKTGRTGFVVNSVADMAAAVGKLGRIKRTDCRQHVEDHFSLSHMINGYEDAYAETLRQFKALAAPALPQTERV